MRDSAAFYHIVIRMRLLSGSTLIILMPQKSMYEMFQKLQKKALINKLS